MMIEEPNAVTVVITMNVFEALDLYRYVLGFRDEDTEEVSAALQVQLAGVVGP